jgi:hypothetical protein
MSTVIILEKERKKDTAQLNKQTNKNLVNLIGCNYYNISYLENFNKVKRAFCLFL